MVAAEAGQNLEMDRLQVAGAPMTAGQNLEK
jgi:hypothetical protein